jgi:hypothetical protein
MQVRPVNKVLDRLDDYTERGEGFRAKCPSHLGESEDSLDIRAGDDGRVLLNCHSGCTFEEIIEALDLEASETFSANGKTKGKPIGPKTSTSQATKTITIEDLPGDPSEYMAFQKEDGTLYYVQKHKGSYFRVVGFDEDGDPLLVAGLADLDPILFGLPRLREAIENGEPIVHTEGCKDANAAQDLGLAGVTSGGCTSWEGRFAADYEGATEVWIIPDNDDEGRDYAQQVAQDLAGVVPTIKVVELPGLDPKGDLSDWLASLELDEENAKERLVALAGESAPLSGAKPWPKKPKNLKTTLPPVEAFDKELLPDRIKGWVLNVAKMMDNAPPDYVAVSAVVEAASLLGRKMGIRPKKLADWTVYPNLWGALVGPPASMKTPSMQTALKPMGKLGKLSDEEFDKVMEAYRLELLMAEAEKQALEKMLKDKAKEVADPSSETTKSELEGIKEQIGQLEMPEEPTRKRFYTNDTTVEKLGDTLASNPNGILLYRDELLGWLRTLDKPDRGPDRAFYIEGWSGDIEHLLDRISRGYLRIPVCLSILGGIQPGPLTRYVGEAMEDEGEKADGLLQRFQLLVWPDLNDMQRTDEAADREARNQAYDVYEKLAALEPENFGAQEDDKDDPPVVHFSEDAQSVYDEWYDTHTLPYRGEEIPAALVAHFGKYRSLLPSLALIFEAIDFVSGESEGKEIGVANTLRAAAWCHYLETHMRRAYSSIIFSPERRAAALLGKIQTGEIRHGAKFRDIRRRAFPGLGSIEHLREAQEILEELGWVRRYESKPPGHGRATEKLFLHPDERD